MATTPLTPPGRNVQVKTFTIARSETTAAIKAMLPKNAQLMNLYLFAATASNAGTTATVSVGNTSTSNEFVSAQDVKTNAGLIRPTTTVGGLWTAATADVPVYAKYAETGTASSAGGPWTVAVEYVITGPGNQ